ncbi:MAG: twin-arginine translocase TatA/TatE family subunit [Acetobacter sp.]|nr:twin-arginine translocase TatA/TatE family subunit [Acetobacter sp.]MBQ5469465.1 twin-arginine translocase TatA/TatE family subunit [Acetobacter sp.]
MGGLSIWHWLIVLIVVLVLFGGGGRISTLMGDVARGLKSFKKNMAEDEPGEGVTPPPVAQIPTQAHLTVSQTIPQASLQASHQVGQQTSSGVLPQEENITVVPPQQASSQSTTR